MRHYVLTDSTHHTEIPAMEVAFQLSGIVDSEDFDNILSLDVGDSWHPDDSAFTVTRTQ